MVNLVEQLKNKDTIFEIAATALHGLLFPFGRTPRQIQAQGQGKARPVVLIHGYANNRSTLLPLEAYLRAAGFDRVFPFSYSQPASIEKTARKLREFVASVRKACRLGRHTVDLVGHSLGGLVARHYMQELGGARAVHQCITLGTPHAGTYSAYWAPTPIGLQLRPGSKFLRDLNDPGRRAAGVRYHSLWAEQDLMILPRESAVYQAGDEQRIDGVGHMGILLHPAALRAVAHRLADSQDIRIERIEHAARAAAFVLRHALSLLRPASSELKPRLIAGASKRRAKPRKSTRKK